MGKTKAQKTAAAKKTVLDDLWAALTKDVGDMSSLEDECYHFDFDHVRNYLQSSEGILGNAFQQVNEKYTGTLEVTAGDRKKILDEVEDSCLTEKAKVSFKKLLKSED